MSLVPSPRPLCARCRRPPALCYSAHLPSLRPATKVVVLQHPRERTVAIGTARMARLCLEGAELHVGVDWDRSEVLAAALADPARPPILLYPGPGARDVVREPPIGPVTLVVVDGTWSNAKNLVRDSAVLSALPRYAFVPPRPSEYRIRREPQDDYVSTIEALATVLGALEGDPARFAAMLTPFRAMVDAHLAARAAHAGRGTPRRKVRRPPPPPPELERLRARWDHLVCVVGEANAWRYVPGAPRPADELVHWVAVRPATGEHLAVIAAPTGPLAPSTSFHLGLDEAVLAAGVDRDALRAQLAAFARPGDVWCSWGYYPRTLARAAGAAVPEEHLDLRGLAQRLGRGDKVGLLEAYLARTLDGAVPSVAPGRAGRRAAGLAELVGRWRGAAAQGSSA
ncbi:MAG: tRNA-uridine aminocarboxypropyltransferase [Kofleriaceae bacterium]